MQRIDPGDGLCERSRREAERESLDAPQDEGEASSECSAGQTHAREHDQIAGARKSTQRRGESQVSREGQAETPLFDVRFFGNRAFVMGAVIASLSMMSIMSLLLYYNLYAQSQEGLGLTPLE